MIKKLSLAAALVLALGLIAAGCGDDDDSSESDADATGAASPAAELRANLTAALQEHVYLAGIAVVQGVTNGLDSEEFTAAADTLDANSVAISDAIGSVYGQDAGKQFLENWRSHIADFVLYTEGKATGDAKKVKQAETNLEAYKGTFGAFMAEANPALDAQAVAEELTPHINSVFDTIDIVVSGKGDPFASLRESASHMPQIAFVLADSIATQMPEEFPATTG